MGGKISEPVKNLKTVELDADTTSDGQSRCMATVNKMDLSETTGNAQFAHSIFVHGTKS